jgi:crotonobetaine/carnitine-CoA ligase
MLAQPPTSKDKKHSIRAILAAPTPPSQEEELRNRFNVPDVLSAYGMTEVNIPVWGRIGSKDPGAAGWTHGSRFEVKIVNPDTDMPVSAGDVGEIVVRPRIPFAFMAGYLNAPDKTIEAWRNMWFHTGDAAFMDHTGRLTFIDRIKDTIRRRGENISASEVEDVVISLPGVSEVAAYAVPSDIPGGEDEVMLAVVLEIDATISPTEISMESAKLLPRFARPRYIQIMQSLPKTATGKVQRAVLRKNGITETTIDCG